MLENCARIRLFRGIPLLVEALEQHLPDLRVAWGATQTLANMAEAHEDARARMSEVGLTEVLAQVAEAPWS